MVFFSGHGSLPGGKGQFLRGPKRVRRQFTHLVRLPGKEKVGNLASGFIYHPDSMPTVSSLLELDPPPRATGKNLWGWRAAKRVLYDGMVQGYGWIAAIPTKDGQCSQVMGRERLGYEHDSERYNIAEDPDELSNVASQHPDVVADLSTKTDAYPQSFRASPLQTPLLPCL